MKRLTLVSVLAIILVTMSGCSLFIKAPPINLIEIEEIQDKIDSKESFILVVANKTQCSPCENYLKGGLRKLSDNDNYNVDYVMIDEIEKQKDMDIMTEIIYEHFNEDDSQMFGVPTTYVVKDGELAERMQGPVVYEHLVERYDKYIKEG